jgi:hypothetical protein
LVERLREAERDTAWPQRREDLKKDLKQGTRFFESVVKALFMHPDEAAPRVEKVTRSSPKDNPGTTARRSNPSSGKTPP